MATIETNIREATERDVGAIRVLFEEAYQDDYPHRSLYDESWLKRQVYADDMIILVAEEVQSLEILGAASVVLDTGAQSDLIAEFGRLVVAKKARNHGVGNHLMEARLRYARARLHIAIVENRTSHLFSQKISLRYDFVPVGFLPLKLHFRERESGALYAQYFGTAMSLRKNHPRIVPEAHSIACIAMQNCGLKVDAIVDEDSPPYPHESEYLVEDLRDESLPALIRIERGRVRNREIFGPLRLHYGFFLLTARNAAYILAKRSTSGAGDNPIAGAIGYIHDEEEESVRVFELISRTDNAVRFLFKTLLERCKEWNIGYVEVDVSAHAPRMQRTLVELGFLPVAYIPAMVFHEVERLDVVKMARIFVPPEFGTPKLMPESAEFARPVIRSFQIQEVLPQIAEAVHRLSLFQGLAEEQVRRVAGTCTITEISSQTPLFAEGDAPRHMYILMEGEVRITLGDPPRGVGIVHVGESVGEVAFLTGDPHSATATAGTKLRAATLSHRDLARLTRQRPDIGVVLYRNLATGLGKKLRRVDVEIALLDAGDLPGAPKANGA